MTARSEKKRSPRRGKPVTQPYWWFQGATVRELVDRLQAAGPDTARLEVHLDGDKMTLEVIGQNDGAARVQPLNESHVCPPICPK